MKKCVLFVSAAALLAAGASAQQLRPGYLTTPQSNQLHFYINNWTPGQELTKTIQTNKDGIKEEVEWEDEEFFTSRVALKPYFVNTHTQVDKNKTEASNKKLLFWVPIGDNAGPYGEYRNALPNGVFDSEVFSAWSYVTHYGNWTSPFGWVPAAFADAAHKHGTLVSGVASIPWAASSGDWHVMMKALAGYANEDGINKVGQFLRYHGVDGLGYNSEFSGGSSFMEGLRTLHGGLVKYMKEKGQPGFENPWYGITTDAGSISYGEALFSSYYNNFGYSTEPRTIFFSNYNWNTSSYLSQDAAAIQATGRDPRDIYLGMNMQAGCASSTEWNTHLTEPYSIGLWGAHSVNYIWIKRNASGSTDVAKQATYQKHLEQFFTNGKRNPAVTLSPVNTLSPSDDFMGMSRYMEARSTLSWDLATEPFISYFNLGNGQFYNWKGERMHNNQWYNLGVQDYMPNWRFWFATELLGTTVPEGIDANFTWDDAYMGGSCLRINANNTEAAYLHLFKTEFELKNSDVVTIRYKVIKGSADLDLVWSKYDAETTEAQGKYGMVFDKEGNTYTGNGNKSGSVDIDADWQTKTITISSRSKLTGTMSLMGLKIANASDLELLIGEISVIRGKADTPAKPTVKRSKVLANNYRGVDGKVYYSMPNTKVAGDPVYNLDVKTSLFKLWSRTDADSEPKFLGTTTSWAGLLFSAPAQNATKIQFGVSAVSLDYETESEIAWGEEMPVGEYVAVDDVKISKSPVTTNEDFEISFIDPNHEPVDWSISDAGGQVYATATNATKIEVPEGLPINGAYDLTVGETTYTGYISITDAKSGRQPIIETLTVDGAEKTSDDVVEISTSTDYTLGYTGRNADGTGSRGIELKEKSVGVDVASLGIGTYKSFSVAFWLKVNTYPSAAPGSLLLIENRTGSWPKNNWGFFWSRTVEGSFKNYLIDGGWGKSLDSGADGKRLYADYEGNMGTGKWNHLVYVFEYNNENLFRMRFYFNGVLQNISTWQYIVKATREGRIGNSADWDHGELTTDLAMSYGQNATETGWVPDSYPLATTDWILVGGVGPNGMAAIDGVIDDFQIWNKAMDQEDVNLSKNGLGGLEKLPEGVLAFWDFEGEPGSNHGFVSKGQKQINAYRFDYLPDPDDKEGAAVQTPIEPIYSAGSPYVPGTGFDVVTSPSWTARKGILTDPKGTGEEGSVKLSYNDNRLNGDYTVTLTLANALGNHSMDYPVFHVSKMGTDAIDGIGADGEGVEAYTVGDGLFVQFAEDGAYTVEVYNVSGVLMAEKSQTMAAGQNMNIRLGVQGVYVVRVLRDGALARTIKVIRK